MKNWVFAFWVLIGIGACKGKPNQPQSIDNKVVEKIIDWNLFENKFKFKNLKAFELKGDSIEKDLVKIDNDLFYKVTQDSFPFDNCYFYSFQSQDSNFTKITILDKAFEEDGDLLWLLIYDRNNRLLSKKVIAENALFEDGSLSLYSKIVTDSTMVLYSTERVFGEIDDDHIRIIKIQKEITFLKNGNFSERLIFKKEEVLKLYTPKQHVIPTIRCN